MLHHASCPSPPHTILIFAYFRKLQLLKFSISLVIHSTLLLAQLELQGIMGVWEANVYFWEISVTSKKMIFRARDDHIIFVDCELEKYLKLNIWV